MQLPGIFKRLSKSKTPTAEPIPDLEVDSGAFASYFSKRIYGRIKSGSISDVLTLAPEDMDLADRVYSLPKDQMLNFLLNAYPTLGYTHSINAKIGYLFSEEKTPEEVLNLIRDMILIKNETILGSDSSGPTLLSMAYLAIFFRELVSISNIGYTPVGTKIISALSRYAVQLAEIGSQMEIESSSLDATRLLNEYFTQYLKTRPASFDPDIKKELNRLLREIININHPVIASAEEVQTLYRSILKEIYSPKFKLKVDEAIKTLYKWKGRNKHPN